MTTHTCKVPAALTQCTCGQWWDNGKAIAGFVARALQEKREAESVKPVWRTYRHHVVPNTAAARFQEWVMWVHQDMFTSANSIHAEYWEHPQGKSYVAIGHPAQTPMIAYQTTGMYLPGGSFSPSKPLAYQLKKWVRIRNLRDEYGYSLVHEYRSFKGK